MYLTYRLETYGAHTLYLNQHSRQSTSIYLYYFFCSIRLNESSRELREIARGDATLSWFASEKKLFSKNWWGAIPPFSGWLLAGVGVTPRIFWGDASREASPQKAIPRARRHPKKRFLARGVTPKTVRKATRMCEASPYCYNLAHIYVSWSYVWKYTNVKVTFLSIKTICRALSLLVLKILAVYWDTRY